MLSCYSVCSVSFRHLKTLHHLPLLHLNKEIGHFCFIRNCEKGQRDSDLQINKVYVYSSNVCITVDACLSLCRSLKQNIKSCFHNLHLPVGDSGRLLLDFLPLRIRNLSLTFFASSSNSRFFFLSSSDILTYGS